MPSIQKWLSNSPSPPTVHSEHSSLRILAKARPDLVPALHLSDLSCLGSGLATSASLAMNTPGPVPMSSFPLLFLVPPSDQVLLSKSGLLWPHFVHLPASL